MGSKFLTSPSELWGTGILGMDTLASVTSCITSAGSSGSSYSKRSRSCLSSDRWPDEVGVPAMPDLKKALVRSRHKRCEYCGFTPEGSFRGLHLWLPSHHHFQRGLPFRRPPEVACPLPLGSVSALPPPSFRHRVKWEIRLRPSAREKPGLSNMTEI